MDSKQSVDDVAVPVWSNRIHGAFAYSTNFGDANSNLEQLLTFWKRKSYPTNLIFLGGFTALEAYSISVIVSFYQSKIVLQALILTLGIFVALTLFACQTKYDFTSWIPYLFGGLWALILFGFMAMFFPYNSTVELCYSGIAALIFSG